MKPTPMNIQLQHGAALITALSILLILTVLGISAMSTSALQERMAGNARDQDVAFEAAETALRAAETYLAGPYTSGDFVNTSTGAGERYFTIAAAADLWRTESTWTGVPTVTFGMNVGTAPSYIIQQIDTTIIDSSIADSSSLETHGYDTRETLISADVGVFQITVRGYGLSTNSRVMLQSNYGILNP